jgi:8-oxo-dGTP pyrophosphatase MutT (NUDIX family)
MGNSAAAIAAYRARLVTPVRQVVLCFLVRDAQVLLARKKRGFGAGKWTGVGGKPLPGETFEATALRETQEEIGVEGRALEPVATLNFYFPYMPVEWDWNQQAHVYLIREWQGKPGESEEVAPRWFNLDDVPLDNMWADSRYWLPQVLGGERITADFIYDSTNDAIEAYVVSQGALQDM